jgi:hypothetical protein
MMTLLAARYPQYGWERNAGYATLEHRTAMRAHGLTPFHRRSFPAVHATIAGEQQRFDFDGADGAVGPLGSDLVDDDLIDELGDLMDGLDSAGAGGDVDESTRFAVVAAKHAGSKVGDLAASRR